MSQIQPKRRPGRPRELLVDLSPSDRTLVWRAQQKRAGGHRLEVMLGGAAWQALQGMAEPGKRAELVEKLILAEARRRGTGG